MNLKVKTTNHLRKKNYGIISQVYSCNNFTIILRTFFGLKGHVRLLPPPSSEQVFLASVFLSLSQAQTVVVSCEEDRALCNKALSLAVPVVSAEFLLTGILQQKVDLQTHALSASPAAASKPASQGRRK